jgi:hypothetical protein
MSQKQGWSLDVINFYHSFPSMHMADPSFSVHVYTVTVEEGTSYHPLREAWRAGSSHSVSAVTFGIRYEHVLWFSFSLITAHSLDLPPIFGSTRHSVPTWCVGTRPISKITVFGTRKWMLGSFCSPLGVRY